jgi:hypothetical protein
MQGRCCCFAFASQLCQSIGYDLSESFCSGSVAQDATERILGCKTAKNITGANEQNAGHVKAHVGGNEIIVVKLSKVQRLMNSFLFVQLHLREVIKLIAQKPAPLFRHATTGRQAN